MIRNFLFLWLELVVPQAEWKHLLRCFSTCLGNTGMAFVVIPHLAADQPSYLPEIIGRETPMPTAFIESGVRPQPNHVYFLPPNTVASLQEGEFRLQARNGKASGFPINFFFESLAASQKNLAIGVVLSGMDGDGALGLQTIKGEGGISMVQEPESARFPEMPRTSISFDHVDMVLPPEQIALRLAQIGPHTHLPEVRQLEMRQKPIFQDQQFGIILRQLKSVSGVDFRLYKPSTLLRRTARRMLMHRIDTLAEYVTFLQNNAKELRELQDDILINVTRFFRDPEVFESLKRLVLPRIVEDRAPDQQVRIWVAGCASGEEVYSIAICLLEYLTGNAVQPSIQIFGTDASERNIQKARAGVFSDMIANDISPERLRRFFVKHEKGYQVAKRVRDLCIFARQNLCHDPPFSRLDLVSCRNVLIYFGPQLQNQLIPTFHYALRQEGFLLLGSSETIRNYSNLFSMVDRKHKVYGKIGDTPMRVLQGVVPVSLQGDKLLTTSEAPLGLDWADLPLQQATDRLVLARFAPPGIVVNEKLEVLQVRGHTRPFLEISPGIVTLQLNRMLREEIAMPVMEAVKRSLVEDIPVRVDGLQLKVENQKLEATLEVLPIHSPEARIRCFLIMFVSSALSGSARHNLLLNAPSAELVEDNAQLIAQLQQDLANTKLYLQSLLDERDARNQELVSANEEIQSSNEELQSTNEELETTKEELQSSNEELQTVNDELQTRNVVLGQASSDLSNLLNSVNLPVLMLSSDFHIRHFTPQTQKVMNLRPSDVGRPFSDIRLNLNVDDLEPLFTDVLDSLGAREIEVQDRDGHWYLLRVRPYRTTENKIDGVVVVLVDIDQVRRTQQELQNARDFSTSIIAGTPLPLVVVDREFRICFTNEAFCVLANSSSQALDKRSLPDLAAVQWEMGQPLRTLLESLHANGEEGPRNQEFEFQTPGKNPSVFLVCGQILKPDGGKFLLVTFRDLTQHKLLEKMLKEDRERLVHEVESTTRELERSREELQALTGNLLTSQEDERRRLARELHDDISQKLAALSAINYYILQHIQDDPESAAEKLQESSGQVLQLSEDVRTLSHRLHPSMLVDLGLSVALQALTEEFGEREEMISSYFAQDVPLELPIEVATVLYRIAQEALRNVAKYAGKTHVKVQLRGLPEGLELQVIDAGIGFDVEDYSPGLGLISMKERARLIGATLKIHSALWEGTRVTVLVPLQEPI